MRRKLLLSISLSIFCLLLLGGRASAQVSYQYTGNQFNLFSCGTNSTDNGTTDCSTPGPNANTSYSASNFVTATLTVTSALPPNLNFQSVTGLPGFQVTMSDGQQTLSSGSSVCCGPGTDTIQASVGSIASNKVNVVWVVTPVINWATPAVITYGTALGPTQLDATANVPGTFAYSPSAGTNRSPGVWTLTVTFTPADATDYQTVQDAVQIVVKGSH
jgi:hypothetical protein